MFSVIIPLYNKAHTIRRTLSSIFAQSFQEFEILIVDDGSTDNGVELINSFVTDHRVRIIHQANQGVSAARNRGVTSAKYDYIAFLDGDDEWLPNYLAKMNESVDRFPFAGMFCCAGYVKDNHGESLRLADKYAGTITQIEYFENPHVYTHVSATVIKRAAFFKTQGFPVGMRKNEDFALLFSIAIQEEVVYCGYPLSIYWGDVPGQATKAESYRYGDVAKRFSLCRDAWQKSLRRKKLFLVFERYELRHIVLGLIRKDDYESLRQFISDLGERVRGDFSQIELRLWSARWLRPFAVAHIYLSKVAWRLNGFPVVR